MAMWDFVLGLHRMLADRRWHHSRLVEMDCYSSDAGHRLKCGCINFAEVTNCLHLIYHSSLGLTFFPHIQSGFSPSFHSFPLLNKMAKVFLDVEMDHPMVLDPELNWHLDGTKKIAKMVVAVAAAADCQSLKAVSQD